jgi:signal recognition particle receptor subunit beta
VALFNYATRELSAKVVYYGPGLSGKTTNIEMVHKMLRPDQKGRLISLPTETDRTLFFDFLPIDLGQIKGFKVRFHLYTVPGQVFYNATRRLVLQGVDGVVFVADSQREMANSNMESLKNLIDNLSSYGKKLEDLPFIIQYNKRDLKNVMSVQEMDQALNYLHVPTFEAVAPAGKGVTETLVAISRLVFAHLRKTLLMPGEMASQEGLMELADDKIRKDFGQKEAEQLEEISDLEEIKEPAAAAGQEVELELEPTSLKGAEAAPPPTPPPPAAPEFEELGEIEVERPKGAAPTVSVKAEGGGPLTFLKFEAPFVSPEGHAVLPALFLDGNANPVRVRIRVTIDEERS